MSRTGAGMPVFEAGHDSAAVEAPSTHWFLAEGATAPLFDTFVLLANPNDSPASVSITYLLSGGKTIVRAYEVGAANSHQRSTYPTRPPNWHPPRCQWS